MFFDILTHLCKENGTSPSAVALAIGGSKSNVTKWKSGQVPKLETLTKLAHYFNVPLSYFSDAKFADQLMREKSEELAFDDFTYAMHNESQGLTEEDKSLLLAMAKQLGEKNKKSGKAD